VSKIDVDKQLFYKNEKTSYGGKRSNVLAHCFISRSHFMGRQARIFATAFDDLLPSPQG
jgi:hypothetical protein